jgi:hypothetical protein
MTIDLSCLLYNNSPLGNYECNEPSRLRFDNWLPDVDEPAFQDTAVKQKYTMLKCRSGAYKYVISLNPYSPAWKRVWRGKIWSAVMTHGLPTKFVTLTYKDGELEGEELERAFSKWYDTFMKRFKRYLKNEGVSLDEFRYLRVMEYGSKHGRLHYHLAFWGIPSYIPKPDFEKMWEIGWVNIQQPKALTAILNAMPKFFDFELQEQLDIIRLCPKVRYQVSGLVGYLIKYLTKGSLEASRRPKGLRIIQPSRNLVPKLEGEDEYYAIQEVRDAFYASFVSSCKYFDQVISRWYFAKSVDRKPHTMSGAGFGSHEIPETFGSVQNECYDVWNRIVDLNRSLPPFKKKLTI